MHPQAKCRSVDRSRMICDPRGCRESVAGKRVGFVGTREASPRRPHPEQRLYGSLRSPYHKRSSSDAQAGKELPPIAVERAASITGFDFHGSDVVIIGDSIYDVRCGVPHGATTIAIASGKTPASKLRAENPDHFFDSAEELDGILSAMVGGIA